jgi:hypothetical protein
MQANSLFHADTFSHLSDKVYSRFYNNLFQDFVINLMHAMISSIFGFQLQMPKIWIFHLLHPSRLWQAVIKS